jgi:hypothetical protein
MLSASPNAAASMVIRELLLLRHFELPTRCGRTAAGVFHDTKRAELGELLLNSLLTPVTRNGLM